MDSESLKLEDKASNVWPTSPFRRRGLQIIHWESPHCVFFVIPIEIGIADICTKHSYYVQLFVENLR